MRVAILASNFIRIPPDPHFVPKGYSGAPEKIMYFVTEAMAERGHDVTLFASGDSITSAKLISVTNTSTSFDPNINKALQIEYEHLLISKCFTMAKQGYFDIIHSIFDVRSAFYTQFVTTPTVSTLHSPLAGQKKIFLEKFKKTQFYISISNAQRKPIPDLNYVATIYHGIDLTKSFPYDAKGGQYIINVGRIIPEKGITTAIQIAKRLNKQLYLLGTGIEDSDYWKKEIVTNFNNNLITQIGFVTKEKLQGYYQNAKLFLFPIRWEEPFGLVMIEAMACGTPVVAFARGSVPEVIKDGETGFIVNSSDDDIRGNWIIKKTGFDGLCEAVEKIYSMPEEQYKQMRKNCRIHVEKNFTIERMVDQYEQVYQEVVSANKKM